MNWFVLINGVMYLFAMTHSLWERHWMWALVWGCYGASCLGMASLEQ